MELIKKFRKGSEMGIRIGMKIRCNTKIQKVERMRNRKNRGICSSLVSDPVVIPEKEATIKRRPINVTEGKSAKGRI